MCHEHQSRSKTAGVSHGPRPPELSGTLLAMLFCLVNPSGTTCLGSLVAGREMENQGLPPGMANLSGGHL